MAWVLLDDNFPNHPKAVQAGPVAAYLFVCGLCYCRRYHTGGFIPAKAIPLLGVTSNPKRMVQALVEVGLWDVAEGGWNVHDYSGFYADEVDKQQKEQERREATDERRNRSAAAKQGWRARKGDFDTGRINVENPVEISCTAYAGRGDGVGCVSDLSLKKKKSEADFANFWSVYPKKDGKQAAFKAWLKIDPTDDEQRAIAADIDRRSRSAQWLKEGGQFIPMASTYLNGRRWEDGFVERPRLAERTVNVLKGFEEIA